jgi:hypothetical protein
MKILSNLAQSIQRHKWRLILNQFVSSVFFRSRGQMWRRRNKGGEGGKLWSCGVVAGWRTRNGHCKVRNPGTDCSRKTLTSIT